MGISTSLTKHLGIEHPVILAPMGFVAGGALAAAVSARGGFGIFGGGYADPDRLERKFALAGNCPVGCDFITWALAERPATLDLALSHHPPAIMLSFGDATLFLPKVKRAGALAICQVQNLAQGFAVLMEGADIIVAQGTEAGGHGGGRSTLPLIPAVVDMRLHRSLERYAGDAVALGEQFFLSPRVRRDWVRRTMALMIEIPTRRSCQLVLTRGEPSLGNTPLVKIVRGRRAAHLCRYPSGFQRVGFAVFPTASERKCQQ